VKAVMRRDNWIHLLARIATRHIRSSASRFLLFSPKKDEAFLARLFPDPLRGNYWAQVI